MRDRQLPVLYVYCPVLPCTAWDWLARWAEERTAVAMELSLTWQPQSEPMASGNGMSSSTTTRPHQGQQQQLLLPPAKGFVRLCGIDVPAARRIIISSSN